MGKQKIFQTTNQISSFLTLCTLKLCHTVSTKSTPFAGGELIHKPEAVHGLTVVVFFVSEGKSGLFNYHNLVFMAGDDRFSLSFFRISSKEVVTRRN